MSKSETWGVVVPDVDAEDGRRHDDPDEGEGHGSDGQWRLRRQVDFR